MNDGDLTSEVMQTLDEAAGTVDELDALLLLLEQPRQWWASTDVARTIGVDIESAREALSALVSRGLASDVPHGSVFRMATEPHISSMRLGALARACRRNRSAVVEHIGQRAMGHLRVLAEAYKRGGR